MSDAFRRMPLQPYLGKVVRVEGNLTRRGTRKCRCQNKWCLEDIRLFGFGGAYLCDHAWFDTGLGRFDSDIYFACIKELCESDGLFVRSRGANLISSAADRRVVVDVSVIEYVSGWGLGRRYGLGFLQNARIYLVGADEIIAFDRETHRAFRNSCPVALCLS